MRMPTRCEQKALYTHYTICTKLVSPVELKTKFKIKTRFIQVVYVQLNLATTLAKFGDRTPKQQQYRTANILRFAFTYGVCLSSILIFKPVALLLLKNYIYLKSLCLI